MGQPHHPISLCRLSRGSSDTRSNAMQEVVYPFTIHITKLLPINTSLQAGFLMLNYTCKVNIAWDGMNYISQHPLSMDSGSWR
ncbi:hypothetical protein GDO86_012004 [Hymenochirus boettgeri]|uniref:Uncharacterized protein n=1 Tax=Hymenochirus boettgeri TaxID=247094 RepID=A0A8T2JLC7_9PIPI|nr:hypothetical protein GDO86_012004 [Hymenochirus boettgeri]